MALISCPECDRRVSDAASVCPQCGYPLTAQKRDRQEPLPARVAAPPVLPPVPTSSTARAVTVLALKCPMCGGSVPHRSRNCIYCGSAIVVTGLTTLLGMQLDGARLAQATARWRERLRQAPEDVEAEYALGMLFLQSRLRDTALVHLRRAVTLLPESSIARFNLAQALLLPKDLLPTHPDYVEARRQIEYALSLDPDFTEAGAWRQYFLGADRAAAPQESLPYLYEATRLCPEVPEFYESYGFALSAAGHYGLALVTLSTAIQLNPISAFAHGALAYTLFRENRAAEGVGWGQKGVELLLSDDLRFIQAYCHNALALCLWKSGDRRTAMKHADAACALFPAHTVFASNRQLIGTTTGDKVAKVASEVGGAVLQGLMDGVLRSR